MKKGVFLVLVFVVLLFGATLIFSIKETKITGRTIDTEQPFYVFADITDLHLCKVSTVLNAGNTDSWKIIGCKRNNADDLTVSSNLERGINGSGGIKEVVTQINSHNPPVNSTVVTGDITDFGAVLSRKQQELNIPNNQKDQQPKTQYEVAKNELDKLVSKYYVCLLYTSDAADE